MNKFVPNPDELTPIIPDEANPLVPHSKAYRNLDDPAAYNQFIQDQQAELTSEVADVPDDKNPLLTGIPADVEPIPELPLCESRVLGGDDNFRLQRSGSGEYELIVFSGSYEGTYENVQIKDIDSTDPVGCIKGMVDSGRLKRKM